MPDTNDEILKEIDLRTLCYSLNHHLSMHMHARRVMITTVKAVPESRERDLALLKIEEALMWAESRMSVLSPMPDRPDTADNGYLFEEIDRRFSYHAPKPEQVPLYNELREHARQFAIKIVDMVPDSRERSLALTKLEECIMHANAGIARRS